MSRRPSGFLVEEDLADRIVLSVRTQGFESELVVPVPLSQKDADTYVKSWLDMISAALKMPNCRQKGE
jgi:hypothetical protein